MGNGIVSIAYCIAGNKRCEVSRNEESAIRPREDNVVCVELCNFLWCRVVVSTCFLYFFYAYSSVG